MEKLIRATTYILCLVGRTPKHRVDRIGKVMTREVTAAEYNDAWVFLLSWDQSFRLVGRKVTSLCPVAKQVQLSEINMELTQVVLSGRIKNFPAASPLSRRFPSFQTVLWAS